MLLKVMENQKLHCHNVLKISQNQKGKHEDYPLETFLKTLLQIVSIDEGKFI